MKCVYNCIFGILRTLALKKNLLYNILLSISQVLFPFITIPYISRVLSAEGIGQVAAIDSFSYFIVTLADLGFGAYAVREIAAVQENAMKRKKRVSELLSLHLLSSAVCLLLLSVYFFWRGQFVYPSPLWQLSLAFIALQAFNTEWYYWGMERFSYIALRSIATRILGIIILFTCVQHASDTAWYYGTIVFTLLLNIVSNSIPLWKQLTWQSKSFSKDLRACIPTYVIAVIHSITLMLDNVVLSITASFSAVAFYSQAAKIVRLSSAFITDSTTVLFPRTSALLAKNDLMAAKQLQQDSMSLSLLLALPLSVGLFVFADPFTRIYFSDSLMPIAYNIKIMSAYPVLKSCSLLYSRQVFMANRLDAIALRGYAWGAVTFIITATALTLLWKDNGNAWAIIFSEVAVLVYFIRQSVHHQLYIPLPYAHLFEWLITSILLFLFCHWVVALLPLSPLLTLIIAVLLSGSLYLLYILFVRPIAIVKQFKQQLLP